MCVCVSSTLRATAVCFLVAPIYRVGWLAGWGGRDGWPWTNERTARGSPAQLHTVSAALRYSRIRPFKFLQRSRVKNNYIKYIELTLNCLKFKIRTNNLNLNSALIILYTSPSKSYPIFYKTWLNPLPFLFILKILLKFRDL